METALRPSGDRTGTGTLGARLEDGPLHELRLKNRPPLGTRHALIFRVRRVLRAIEARWQMISIWIVRYWRVDPAPGIDFIKQQLEGIVGRD